MIRESLNLPCAHLRGWRALGSASQTQTFVVAAPHMPSRAAYGVALEACY
jgi:hypothetical protein